MRRLHRLAAVLFPLSSVLMGAYDITQPEELRAAMDAISMPHYILLILGVAKLAGGLALLLPTPLVLREWAFAGFFVWWSGAVSTHLITGEGLSNLVPLGVLGALLAVSFREHAVRREIRPIADA